MDLCQLDMWAIIEPPPRWDAIEWLERAHYLASWDRWRASSKVYDRFRKHARQMTIERARQLNAAEIEVVLPALEHAIYNPFCGQLSVWDRPEIGALVVEVRNRRTLLSLGRDRPKDKGARFDPTKMPMEAIDRLIQRHPDMGVVEQLRAEKNRRMTRANV